MQTEDEIRIEEFQVGNYRATLTFHAQDCAELEVQEMAPVQVGEGGLVRSREDLRGGYFLSAIVDTHEKARDIMDVVMAILEPECHTQSRF